MPFEIFRTAVARKRLGLSHGGFFEHRKKGLITDAIPLGKRARGYPSDEIEAIARARVAGWTDAQVAELVIELVGQRQDKFEALTGMTAALSSSGAQYSDRPSAPTANPPSTRKPIRAGGAHDGP